jgi:hypothetical protein
MHAVYRLAEKLLPFHKEPCFVGLIVMARTEENASRVDRNMFKELMGKKQKWMKKEPENRTYLKKPINKIYSETVDFISD